MNAFTACLSAGDPAAANPSRNPVVQRLRLRRLLREARLCTGLTQHQVAAELGCSPTTILRAETGQVVPSVLVVRGLLALYRMHETIPQAVEMARVARSRSWTAPYHQVFTPAQTACMAIEPVAETIHNVATLSIAPLLRTGAYARDVARVLRHRDPDRYAEGTLQRQRQVFGNPCGRPRVTVYIDEPVLWRCTNDRVGTEQLDHIEWRARTGQATVRVIPLAEGFICTCSFTVLEVPDPAQTLLYVEDPNELALADRHDQATITWHRHALEWAHRHALPADALPQVIDTLRSRRPAPTRQIRDEPGRNQAPALDASEPSTVSGPAHGQLEDRGEARR